jgi:steroid delta-isomerase-like uncharacterized protein
MFPDPVALLSRYAEVKNQHDVEGMLALTHPDCRYEDVGVGRVLTGREELRRYHQHLFTALPDYQATIDGVAGTDDTAIAWGSFAGTLAGPLFGNGAMGQRIEVAAVFVCGFRDGLLYRERAHVDLLTLRRQAPRPDPGSAFLAAFTEAWAEPTGARLATLFTEDATMLHPGMAEPARGRPAIGAYFETLLTRLPGIRLSPLASSVHDGTAFIHWRMHATVAGDPLSWDGIDRFDLRGEHAAHGVAHFDPAQARISSISS